MMAPSQGWAAASRSGAGDGFVEVQEYAGDGGPGLLFGGCGIFRSERAEVGQEREETGAFLRRRWPRDAEAEGVVEAGGVVGTAVAQDASDETDTSVAEIVVTGVAKATNRLDTSVSVSALDVESVDNVAPRGTAEIFRRLPGIRAESSAGGGNSNMQVRGLPAVTGGAQFISLQEDGLPVLLFGDHNFAPADGFVKVDATLARIESVRGGSAATLTTNGNGAVAECGHCRYPRSASRVAHTTTQRNPPASNKPHPG